MSDHFFGGPHGVDTYLGTFLGILHQFPLRQLFGPLALGAGVGHLFGHGTSIGQWTLIGRDLRMKQWTLIWSCHNKASVGTGLIYVFKIFQRKTQWIRVLGEQTETPFYYQRKSSVYLPAGKKTWSNLVKFCGHFAAENSANPFGLSLDLEHLTSHRKVINKKFSPYFQ